MQETVFIKEAMEHASIDLLFFDDVRFLESLHLLDQVFDSGVNLRDGGLEDLLEIFISGLVNLLIGVLGRLVGFREEDGVLSNQVFDLELSFLRDTHSLRSSVVGWGLVFSHHVVGVLKVLDGDTELLLVELRFINILIAVGFEVLYLLLVGLVTRLDAGQGLGLDIVSEEVFSAGSHHLFADVVD